MFWQVPLLVVVLSPIWWRLAADFLTIDVVQQQSQGTSHQAQSSFDMWQVKISEAENGKEEMRLDASHLYSKDNQKVLFFDDPVARLVGDREKPVTITGGSAVYDTTKEIITLLDDVELRSPDTQVLTPALRYMVKYKKVKSAESVEVNREGMRITGTSFFYDLVSGDFRVGKRVVCNLW